MACFEYAPSRAFTPFYKRLFQLIFSPSLTRTDHSRFLMDNLDWLESELGETGEESLTIFDCPGQIELYTHVPILPNLAKHLTGHMSFNLCAAYLLESTFVIDKTKFFAGTLSAMSCMIMLEIPHINILSKMDLVRNQVSKRELKRFLDPDPSILATDIHAETNPKFHRLNECMPIFPPPNFTLINTSLTGNRCGELD